MSLILYNNNVEQIKIMTMQKNNFEIQLTLFPGFYESALYNCDTLYWETTDDEMEYWRDRFDDESLTADDLDIDFPRFKEECCKAYIDAFFNNQLCPDFIEKMEYSDLTSPRYYNFETDKLYVNVELAEDWRDKVKTFMEENKEWLTKRIKEDWTSRDGFCSFMDNTYDYWCDELQKDEPDVRYLGVIVTYMMEIEKDDVYEEIITDTLEDFYVSEYIINLKEEKKS